jgi:hypothetical protein
MDSDCTIMNRLLYVEQKKSPIHFSLLHRHSRSQEPLQSHELWRQLRPRQRPRRSPPLPTATTRPRNPFG